MPIHGYGHMTWGTDLDTDKTHMDADTRMQDLWNHVGLQTETLKQICNISPQAADKYVAMGMHVPRAAGQAGRPMWP